MCLDTYTYEGYPFYFYPLIILKEHVTEAKIASFIKESKAKQSKASQVRAKQKGNHSSAILLGGGRQLDG